MIPLEQKTVQKKHLVIGIIKVVLGRKITVLELI